MIRAENRRKLLHEIERGEDGHGEQRDLTGARGFDRVGGDFVDGAHFEREAGLFRAAVPADNAALEPGLAESEPDGCAKKAGAEDADAIDHGSFREAEAAELTPMRSA